MMNIILYSTDLASARSSKNFKEQRQEERRASEASGNTRAWNSLFMHPDTVCSMF